MDPPFYGYKTGGERSAEEGAERQRESSRHDNGCPRLPRLAATPAVSLAAASSEAAASQGNTVNTYEEIGAKAAPPAYCTLSLQPLHMGVEQSGAKDQDHKLQFRRYFVEASIPVKLSIKLGPDKDQQNSTGFDLNRLWERNDSKLVMHLTPTPVLPALLQHQ